MNSTRLIILFLGAFIIMVTATVFVKGETVKFKVFGNCSMCESRIEKAALTVEGVTEADWSEKSKMLKVSFDASKTDINNINSAIASAGHDTENFRADDTVYNKLPGCCRYERSLSNKEADTGMKESCGTESGCCGEKN